MRRSQVVVFRTAACHASVFGFVVAPLLKFRNSELGLAKIFIAPPLTERPNQILAAARERGEGGVGGGSRKNHP